jgi:A/G-specific adenine glycosylase
MFWLRRADGRALLRRRPDKGLLASMIEVPSTPWVDVEKQSDGANSDWRKYVPAACEWRRLEGQVHHTFTHFHLVLDLMVADTAVDAKAVIENVAGEIWADPHDLSGLALPTVMKKVVRLALAEDRN